MNSLFLIKHSMSCSFRTVANQPWVADPSSFLPKSSDSVHWDGPIMQKQSTSLQLLHWDMSTLSRILNNLYLWSRVVFIGQRTSQLPWGPRHRRRCLKRICNQLKYRTSTSPETTASQSAKKQAEDSRALGSTTKADRHPSTVLARQPIG